MKLGVDIDGVVSDSYTYWLGALNKHFNKEIKELHDYKLELLFDVPWQEMNRFFVENVEALFMSPQPMPGVKRALEMIKAHKHEIQLITARREEEEEITRRWLRKYQIPYDQLQVIGDKSKAEICQTEQISLFVEDYAVNAELISDLGIPVIILDAGYNRVKLPDSVIRCYNWGQIIDVLDRRFGLLDSSEGIRASNLE